METAKSDLRRKEAGTGEIHWWLEKDHKQRNYGYPGEEGIYQRQEERRQREEELNPCDAFILV